MLWWMHVMKSERLCMWSEQIHLAKLNNDLATGGQHVTKILATLWSNIFMIVNYNFKFNWIIATACHLTHPFKVNVKTIITTVQIDLWISSFIKSACQSVTAGICFSRRLSTSSSTVRTPHCQCQAGSHGHILCSQSEWVAGRVSPCVANLRSFI